MCSALKPKHVVPCFEPCCLLFRVPNITSTYIYLVLLSVGRTYEKEVGPLSRKIGEFVSTKYYMLA